MTSSTDHHHEHPAHGADEETRSPSEFWEDFYSTDTHPWTGNPNELLTNALTVLADDGFVGTTALDLGCGSGADAVYLAERGMAVTAVDISAAALKHGRSAAERVGVSSRITWRQIDLDSEFPSGSWDLVTTSYLHSPVDLERTNIVRNAASAVNPGGVLIIIGHDGVPHWNADAPEDFSFPSVDEVIAEFDLDNDWTVQRKDLISITIGRPEGQLVDRTDSLIVLRRR